MIYREAGQFKTSYAADQAVFPILQDRIVVGLAAGAAFVAVPLAANEYWLQAILIPFLIYALAAIGLNVLTGYAGQLSLGTGGFMAVGAYAAGRSKEATTQMGRFHRRHTRSMIFSPKRPWGRTRRNARART